MIRLGVYRSAAPRDVSGAKRPGSEEMAAALADFLWQREQQALGQSGGPRDSGSSPLEREHAAEARIRPKRCRSCFPAACGPIWRLIYLRKLAGRARQSVLPPSDRRKNLKGAFHVPRRFHHDLDKRRILLVDDVLTTVRTANEAARVLLAAGASSVVVAVIVRGLGKKAHEPRPWLTHRFPFDLLAMEMPPQADPPTSPAPAMAACRGMPRKSHRPPPKKATATQFFLKGLAIVLPPILTLVILVWIGQMIYGYVVNPITTGVRFVIAEVIDNSRPTFGVRPRDRAPAAGILRPQLSRSGGRAGRRFSRRALRSTAKRRIRHKPRTRRRPPRLAAVAYIPFGERSVPYRDFAEVAARMRPTDWPATATGLYMELVTIRYFKSLGSLSALATALTIIALYFLGRFVTARMGQWVVSRFETLVLARVPIISSVYSSVKQVTDFFFSERPIAYNRVVAVEFPRRGVWTIGFAMGESLIEMTLAAGEQMISVMIPAAPMPMTGWVVSVPKSAIVDLNISLGAGIPILPFVRRFGARTSAGDARTVASRVDETPLRGVCDWKSSRQTGLVSGARTVRARPRLRAILPPGNRWLRRTAI